MAEVKMDRSAKAGRLPKIILSGISKRFQSRRQTITAVEDVNMSVNTGEFVSIVGPSGCGKSTIIRMIDGIIRPSSGKITIGGNEIDSQTKITQEIVGKIGFTFQLPNLYPWMTIRENVALPLKIFGLRGSDWEDYVTYLLQTVKLEQYADKYPTEISGGMLQRAGVIRAMVYRPEILLMDEPFGALDEMTREELNLELLDIWADTGLTIIFITHNVQEAVLLSDRIYVMSTNPGKIISEVQIGLPRERTLEMTNEDQFIAYCDTITRKIGTVNLDKIK